MFWIFNLTMLLKATLFCFDFSFQVKKKTLRKSYLILVVSSVSKIDLIGNIINFLTSYSI